MAKERITTFVAQELSTFSIKKFILQNALNINNTRPWPSENSSVAHRFLEWVALVTIQKTSVEFLNCFSINHTYQNHTRCH